MDHTFHVSLTALSGNPEDLKAWTCRAYQRRFRISRTTDHEQDPQRLKSLHRALINLSGLSSYLANPPPTKAARHDSSGIHFKTYCRR